MNAYTMPRHFLSPARWNGWREQAYGQAWIRTNFLFERLTAEQECRNRRRMVFYNGEGRAPNVVTLPPCDFIARADATMAVIDSRLKSRGL